MSVRVCVCILVLCNAESAVLSCPKARQLYSAGSARNLEHLEHLHEIKQAELQEENWL